MNDPHPVQRLDPSRPPQARGRPSARHEPAERDRNSLLIRKRFQLVGATLLGALIPWVARGPLLPGSMFEPASLNTLTGNLVAVLLAFWTRLSIETYPGIRRSAVILPAALTGHGVAVAWFVLTRFPYDRVGLAAGFLLHVSWLYILYIFAERKIRRRIAIVPFGTVEPLLEIHGVDWRVLKRPNLHDARACHALVADFNAELPAEWAAFLADAALEGKIVYQVKQLSESLTGQVEIKHLSENSFGSLVPAQGYFHFKALLDFLTAIAVSPVVAPLMLLIAIAIRIDSSGPPIFRQKRVGHAGRQIMVYKFRTMRGVEEAIDRKALITVDRDPRITRVGRVLRHLRIDELPQIINILKWEMSWIGPRPEAHLLSGWYTDEVAFYRYRHVVKPGITGWAQVNQGHVAEVQDIHAKLHYDFYYIKYFSPWLDVLIVFRTIKTMLTGWGAR